MRCSCGHENPNGVNFCSECGKKLEVVCPACSTTNSPSNKFCHQCGQDLSSISDPEIRFGSPGTYTPKYLAERILTSKAALEGERKHVTVLFADMKGSMEFLADRDPEESKDLLDPVLERMMEAVHRYEGMVNQVMGDGIMALFGAPLAMEDHALRACYAALAIQGAIRSYSSEVRRSHGVEVQVRVGLNSGEVVVRSIGSDLDMDYSAVGQTTHLAARMEQHAPPGSIRLTAETLHQAEGFLRVEPLGPIPVRGIAEPVEVFELVGGTPTRTRFQATATGGLARFVGRQNELSSLKEALDQAGAGNGQVMAVVGEAGVGKSRLYWEFTRSKWVDGWFMLESGSVSFGMATAYLPVINLLKTYFGIEDPDDSRRIREKITGKIFMLDGTLGPFLPAYFELLEVPVEDPAWKAIDPHQRQKRTLDALKHLFLRESQVQPLILIFEDLHWIDLETQELLDTLVESIPTARLLLLVNYRPNYKHKWANKTYYAQLRLDSLPPESAEELLLNLLGDDSSLEPLFSLLIERAQGNPLFLEESVRTLVETGALMGEPGSRRLTKALPAIKVPATVHSLIDARIDRLPPQEKSLLQTASIIGKNVSFSLLQTVSELSEDELCRCLSDLQAAEFLYETSLFPELEYTFKHSLTLEVAYGSLLHEKRRALHGRVAEALEKLAGDQLDEYIERLAHHTFNGEIWDKASIYLQQAGEKTMARSANQDAANYFEQLLATLQRLPKTRETLEKGVDVRLDLRNALLLLGENDRMLQYLHEAETLSVALEDHGRLGKVSSCLSNYYWRAGMPDKAIASGERILGLLERFGDLDLKVLTNYRLSRAYHALGDLERAIEFAKVVVRTLEGDLLYERLGMAGLPSVLSRCVLALSLSAGGKFTEGLAYGEEGVQIADKAKQAFSQAVAYFSVGFLHLRKGEFDNAIQSLKRSLEVCRDENITIRAPRSAAALGYAYTLSSAHGTSSESLDLLEESVKKADSLNFMNFQALQVTWLGGAYLQDGKHDKAMECGERALVLSREHKERGNEGWALRLLGEIHSHADFMNPGKAEEFYLQALSLAQELGRPPLVAHCRRGLWNLYQKTNREDEAQDHLTQAVELYRSMEMTFWLKKVEEAMAEVGEQFGKSE